MLKWYEREGADDDIVVASRVRLQRNLKGYLFPVKMTDEDLATLDQQLERSFACLQTTTGLDYDTMDLQQLSDRARMALQERQLISHGIAENTHPMSMMLSKDESVGLIFNGEDHIRLQVSCSGLNLEGAWAQADRLDDQIKEKYEYAFDPKFGYMTTYPTHLGTGMRAYLLLHLPLLSGSKRFSATMQEVSRFGIVMKQAFGSDGEAYGDMYVIYNQKTLGQSEEDLIAVLNKIGRRILEQETKLRELAMQSQKDAREDQTYRAYGLLRYARSLTIKDALHYLSKLRLGATLGLIQFETPVSLFQMMQCCQSASLQTMYHREMSEEEQNRYRAEYIRKHLPECKEEE